MHTLLLQLVGQWIAPYNTSLNIYCWKSYRSKQLENERIAINNFLKDQGFYTAKLGWTYFEIDTTSGPQNSTVACVVSLRIR